MSYIPDRKTELRIIKKMGLSDEVAFANHIDFATCHFNVGCCGYDEITEEYIIYLHYEVHYLGPRGGKKSRREYKSVSFQSLNELLEFINND